MASPVRSPCLYWVFPFPMTMGKHGPLLYAGETENFSRRFTEHLSRLLDCDGFKQQPFYRYIQASSANQHQLVAELCFLMMIPVKAASAEKQYRLIEESGLVKQVGTLNPPKVYSLLLPKRRVVVPGVKLFAAKRPLCRLRGPPEAKVPLPCFPPISLLRRDWRSGLVKTASALAGHRFSGCDAAAVSAWNLSPGAWAFVARRVDQFEEGWRRLRGLALLRKISRRRPDLCPLISEIHVKVPWPGSDNGRQVLCNSVRRLLASWRSQGKWIPVLCHAKCYVSWTRSPSLGDVLCNAHVLRDCLAENTEPSCDCEALLAGCPSWPAVTFDGSLHIAASQSCVPWPEQLQCLSRWPASVTLPPRWEDVASDGSGLFPQAP